LYLTLLNFLNKYSLKSHALRRIIEKIIVNMEQKR
jgi:hypothetical protein